MALFTPIMLQLLGRAMFVFIRSDKRGIVRVGMGDKTEAVSRGCGCRACAAHRGVLGSCSRRSDGACADQCAQPHGSKLRRHDRLSELTFGRSPGTPGE